MKTTLDVWWNRRSILRLGMVAPLASLLQGSASEPGPRPLIALRLDRNEIFDGEVVKRHLEPHRDALRSALLIAIEGGLDASSEEIRIILSAVARIAGSRGSVHYVARTYTDEITIRVLRA
jgi:hypothetical protein